MWNHKYFDSRILNNIYWELGPFEFVKQYSKGLEKAWNERANYARGVAIDNEKKVWFEKCESYSIDAGEEKIRVVFSTKYGSDTTFFYPENNLIIIRNNKQFSLRSSHDLTDLYEQLAGKNITCGGHPGAGGGAFDNSNDDLMTIAELFVNYIND